MAFLFNRDRVFFRHVAGELTLPEGHKVTDPFGDRFMIQGGAQLELPVGETLATPPDLETSTLASGQAKLDNEVEVPLPPGTQVVLPPGSLLRFAKNARVPLAANGAIDKYTRIVPCRAGVFDYFDVVYRLDEEDLYRPFMRKPGSNEFYSSDATCRTYQMSDHLPIWVEFQVDFAREYLDDVEAELQAKLDG